MGLWRSLGGMVSVELTSADPAGFLSAAVAAGLDIQEIRFVNPLVLTASVARDSYRVCKALAEKRGEKLRTLQKSGIYWAIKEAAVRPILWLGILTLLLAVIYIPRHIFFIRVEGNNVLPDKMILEQAELCGISFGAERSHVRSEKVKNALLLRMPQLQWAGINTKGCVATIQVREKTTSETVEPVSFGVCSIVAVHEGIVREATAVRGNLLCKPGQAVKAGQVLISGYTDCGLSIRATRAEGEIFAETLRKLRVSAMSEPTIRQEIVNTKTRYCLKIGKKIIKLYKDSGISDTTCVKMYSEIRMALPGGFALPVTLIKESLYDYDLEVSQLDISRADWMHDYAGKYLETQMLAGKILSNTAEVSEETGVLILDGRYACLEMIGRVKNEEIITPNGEDD